MTRTATNAPAPPWVLQIMREIDTLDFGAGFGRLTGDTDLYFGTAHVHGAEAIKAFFARIDGPLNITHEVIEFWTANDGACLLRGEAAMARKTEPGTVVRAPFMHIFYPGETEPARIKAWRITAGPLQTDAVL